MINKFVTLNIGTTNQNLEICCDLKNINNNMPMKVISYMGSQSSGKSTVIRVVKMGIILIQKSVLIL